MAMQTLTIVYDDAEGTIADFNALLAAALAERDARISAMESTVCELQGKLAAINTATD